MKNALLIETDRSMQKYFSKLMHSKLGFRVFPITNLTEARAAICKRSDYEVVVCNYDVSTEEEDAILEFVRRHIPSIDVYLNGYLPMQEVLKRGNKVVFCNQEEFLDMFSRTA